MTVQGTSLPLRREALSNDCLCRRIYRLEEGFMRFVAVMLVMVQLLLRGVAVPHCHAHDGLSQPTEHSNRPHIHVLPHSHSHATTQDGSRHGHSHHHAPPHQDSPAPVSPGPADSMPPAPEHHQDALYTGCEPLAIPLDRIQAPEPTLADWFLAEIPAQGDASLVHLIEYRAAGPPGQGFGTSGDLLPHLLRV